MCARLDIETPIGTVRILWRYEWGKPRIQRISLGRESAASSELPAKSCPEVDTLGDQLCRYLSGEEVNFERLEGLALETLTPFQRQVLLLTCTVPRGSVTSYKRLACALGIPNAPRAVGRALARNPFPLLIPCHRVIRTDGHIGEYGGGSWMKRALLELEGVTIGEDGRVRAPRWYPI